MKGSLSLLSPRVCCHHAWLINKTLLLKLHKLLLCACPQQPLLLQFIPLFHTSTSGLVALSHVPILNDETFLSTVTSSLHCVSVLNTCPLSMAPITYFQPVHPPIPIPSHYQKLPSALSLHAACLPHPTCMLSSQRSSMQSKLTSSYYSLHGKCIYLTLLITNYFHFTNASVLKYWSQEHSAGLDTTLIIVEDENEAYHWLVESCAHMIQSEYMLDM